YEPIDWSKVKPLNLGSGINTNPPRIRTAAPSAQQPQQARVVPLPSKDYLRFLHPNANLVAGFDFEKVFRSPELMEALFGQAENEDARNKVIGALKEMDHLWLSFVAPQDLVVLTTGKFEQGAAAGLFYAQGIRPVFLGGARVMMIGSEPSIQAALARMARPAANDGWVTRRAKELSRDHETWIVNELQSGANHGVTALRAIRQFALGARLTGDAGLDGEAVTDSEASALKIAAWVEQMKAAIREKTGVGALDSLTVKCDGSTVRFMAKGDTLLAGDAGKAAMNTDFGVELYGVIMGGFPGMPPRTVAGDKLLSVQTGMKREEVLRLLGEPLSVAAIQGLDIPRETWTYQVPFGKQHTVRLDGGVVSAPPRAIQ
ncbi:MAG TPA: hypothetical protein VGV35_11885, partial [Bryobacteraceae bacterium]|nr:hypothetical protein [Bryobacteraceae bacterium]